MNRNPSKPIGQRRWAIVEGYIPAISSDMDAPRFVSHETAGLLNCNDVEAHVTLRIYYADREPTGPYNVTVAARRPAHAIQRSQRTRIDSAGYQLRQRHRIGCAYRGSALTARFAPDRTGADVDRGLRGPQLNWGQEMNKRDGVNDPRIATSAPAERAMKQASHSDRALALTLGGLATAAALLGARKRARVQRGTSRANLSVAYAEDVHVRAARGFNRSSSLLALSVLADSSLEHYRGSFANPAMFVPLVSATLSLLAGLHGGHDRHAASHRLRRGIYAFAAAAGLAGTGFHLYNVTKRVGGWSWNNLFYAAPLGAPAALLLTGGLGAMGERLRDKPAEQRRLLGMPAGQALALAVSAGLMGTVAEAGLLHFRGAFQHPAMFAPLVIPPVSAALLVHAALSNPQPRPWTRRWLRLTTWLGFVGVGFHARGIARCHGGWRNWSQNILAGPPVPAPPSFTALAIAGLAALRLREIER